MFVSRLPVFKQNLNLDHCGSTLSLTIPTAGKWSQSCKNMPALRPLLMTVKVFLSQHGLNSAATGGSSSYVLAYMIIHFMQVPLILISGAYFVLNRDFLLMQADPCGRPQSWIDDPIGSESLGYLLLDFMEHYGSKFPYETHYLHSRLGSSCRKRIYYGYRRTATANFAWNASQPKKPI
ncbi:hypothetical protein BKA82DRAFT_2768110 [Pisolithus tinctorius]|nr:hypothetical protein BKA82DRAFT_2768110 [Pisolithus tinctorius]